LYRSTSLPATRPLDTIVYCRVCASPANTEMENADVTNVSRSEKNSLGMASDSFRDRGELEARVFRPPFFRKDRRLSTAPWRRDTQNLEIIFSLWAKTPSSSPKALTKSGGGPTIPKSWGN